MFSLSASLANSLTSPGFSASTSIELAGIRPLLSKIRATATLPRVTPSASKAKDMPPILIRSGATAVNPPPEAGSSQDAMLREESDVSLPLPTTGVVRED